jgi:opacity protein-like surface antigen
MKKAASMTAAVVAATLMAAPAFAQGWTGFYAGGQLGYSDQSAGADNGNNWQGGLQAGYNHDFGGVVVGGEVEYKYPDSSISGGSYKDSIALKARLGYDLNGTLLYGTVGGVRGSVDTGIGTISDNGIVYGVGVEHPLSDSWTVGLEVLQTEYSTFNGGSSLYDTSAALRVNYRF